MEYKITQLMTVFGCRDLYGNLNSVNPSTLSYDQSIIPTLNVKVTEYWNVRSNLIIIFHPVGKAIIKGNFVLIFYVPITCCDDSRGPAAK